MVQSNDAFSTAAERALAQTVLRDSHDELVSHCQSLDAGAWEASDGPGRWTVRGILEHLAIIEQRITTLTQAMLAQPPESHWRELTAAKDAELAEVASAARKIEAPEILHPTNSRSAPELLKEFQLHRLVNIELAGRADLPLKQYVRKHPALGPLNAWQWLVVTGYHTRRHLNQMRRAAAVKA